MIASRFWAKVNKDGPIPEFAPHLGPCWLWTGRLDPKGYGRYGRGTGTTAAHRLAYEDLVGPIPEGLTIDHLCRVRCCVNPAHMEPVTAAENTRRGLVLITHCPAGHEYTEANTRLDLSRGHLCRKCRTCERERMRPPRSPIVCDCGMTVTAGNLAEHRRRSLHAEAMR